MSAAGLACAYARAERLLPGNAERLVVGGCGRPRFLPGSDRFVLTQRADDGERILLVDPAADTVEQLDAPPPELAPEAGWSISPDGRWGVRHERFDLVLRDRRSGAERALTDDGSVERPYGHQLDWRRVERERRGLPSAPLLVWSPDSSAFAVERLDQTRVRTTQLVETRADEPRPRLLTLRDALAGDAHVPTSQLLVGHVEQGTLVPVALEPLPAARPLMTRPSVRWSADGARLELVAESRDQHAARLYAIDPRSGAARLVLEESRATTLDVAPLLMQPPNARVLGDGRALWWSERDGWGHLWLVDGDAWRQLTRGEWVVRELLHVDERAGVVLFSASGREPDGGPYDRRLYRVSLDGGEPELLSAEPLDHEVVVAPSGAWLIDAMASVEQPERVVLRAAADGTIVRELAAADASALHASGWRAPMRFTVAAADGETELHGLLHLPSGFVPSAHWPLVDAIYPGPQQVQSATRFGITPWHCEALAELGLVVMTLDARGTPLRAKAFHDGHDRLAMTSALADHAAAVAQLAARYPWIDATRVGVVGHSGGGHAAVRALIDQPDTFHVAVAGVGNHDNRRYHAGWGERWIGLVEDQPEAWARQSNVELAASVRGRLLLGLAELDVNVHPSNTRALIAALVAADVDHEVVVLPDHDHWIYDSAHFTRRIWDHLVRHLLGEEPLPYRIAPGSLNGPPA